MWNFKRDIYRTTSGCTAVCGPWSYTYTPWSAWSTCVGGTQSRTRTVDGTRTCTLDDCSTYIDTSSTIESESQPCVVPCVDCSLSDVNINGQVWTACNLNVETYRNGNIIPYEPNPTNWASLTTGAWCWHSDDPANGCKYGKLYNWYAVNDPRGLAPNGYHIPTKTEWETLRASLGGPTLAGGPLKQMGTTLWFPPNTGATNTTGFTAVPGGLRADNSTITPGVYVYSGKMLYSNFWSATQNDASTVFAYTLIYDGTNISTSASNKQFGMSVRLVKD
jgi:uncharacterized protein (TIGR02145 family)